MHDKVVHNTLTTVSIADPAECNNPVTWITVKRGWEILLFRLGIEPMDRNSLAEE
ncbi:hypothetical protein [Paramicrobacterium agarici]|uniref:Uncharacterized protein n=1 Tax=Paramicrobacterium agarici TaxID=630514 RepID=A0A2A9DWJ9_9MICO|nr:hypothetical protein [Microbacterium agarici]PFG31058.1 hypothetical protein ATJ78_2003 [Microbacterium agarici]